MDQSDQFERACLDGIEIVRNFGIKNIDDPKVCYHFSSPEDEQNDLWGNEAQCVKLSTPIFESLPFKTDVECIGGHVGIEAWERLIPCPETIKNRIAIMSSLADKSKMEFYGRSFEPGTGPWWSAGVEVIDRHSPEGEAAISAEIELASKEKNNAQKN